MTDTSRMIDENTGMDAPTIGQRIAEKMTCAPYPELAAEIDAAIAQATKPLVEALEYCRNMAIDGGASHRDCIVGACDHAFAAHRAMKGNL